MNYSQQGQSLAAGASLSHKTVNQDSFASIQNHKADLSAIVVADGLGSHYGAEFASSIAVRAVAKQLEAAGPGEAIDMCILFDEAWQKILEHAHENPRPGPSDLDSKDAFGTTLLCAVETKEQIILGYVGNGAIFHIRGNFTTFPPQQLLPWTAINYLNPHSIPQNGRAAISRLLSLKAQPQQTTPTVLKLSKDQQSCGDIIFCCTDGIYSYDQTAIGYDDKSEIWVRADPTVPLFFASLGSFFQGPVSGEALTTCLESYLQDIDAKRLVEDDCTTAVLITAKALGYQRSLRNSAIESVIV